jgi:transposase
MAKSASGDVIMTASAGIAASRSSEAATSAWLSGGVRGMAAISAGERRRREQRLGIGISEKACAKAASKLSRRRHGSVAWRWRALRKHGRQKRCAVALNLASMAAAASGVMSRHRRQ